MAPPTKLSFRIPTYERLGASPPNDSDENARQIALDWGNQFSSALSERDTPAVLRLLCDDALWRDTNALTWDFRTFDGSEKIAQFLDAQLGPMKVTSFQWKNFAQYQQPFPDTAWILCSFSFETSVGICSCVARLVYTPVGHWKGYTIYTNLDNLKAFPELIGPHRTQAPVSGVSWLEGRRRELSPMNEVPVLITGAGESGLILAARLKYLGIQSILIEKDARIGDSWRKRYDSLCLHFPVWYDHMPYVPFPPTWPKYTPGPKIADWLESYATTLELNVWTASTVLAATQGPDGWTVRVQREGEAAEHIFRVRHFVLSTGQGDGVPRIPDIPNQEEFHGSIVHSTRYKNPQPYTTKRVLVVGAGNSAHDVAADMARNGIDVTLLQRSSTFIMDLDKGWKFLGGFLYSEGGPPLQIADLLTHSMPHLLLEGGMAQRGAKAILADQKQMIDGLRNLGYNASLGYKDAGILLSLKQNGGGHHFDTGAAELIIQKAIKIKSGTQIKKFKSDGVQFEDGTELEVDAVIYATGCGDMRNFIRNICGDAVADQCPPMAGLNDEGEISWFRTLPVKGLWYIHGNFHLNRFYSKHVAMYIKAEEEGLIESRYASDIGPECISLRI